MPGILRHFPKLFKAQNIHHCEYTYSRLCASDTALTFGFMTNIKLNLLNEIVSWVKKLVGEYKCKHFILKSKHKDHVNPKVLTVSSFHFGSFRIYTSLFPAYPSLVSTKENDSKN